MLNWKNLDTLSSYAELQKVKAVNLKEVMTGENGAARVKNYSVPMAEGMAYNYAGAGGAGAARRPALRCGLCESTAACHRNGRHHWRRT